MTTVSRGLTPIQEAQIRKLIDETYSTVAVLRTQRQTGEWK